MDDSVEKGEFKTTIEGELGNHDQHGNGNNQNNNNDNHDQHSQHNQNGNGKRRGKTSKRGRHGGKKGTRKNQNSVGGGDPLNKLMKLMQGGKSKQQQGGKIMKKLMGGNPDLLNKLKEML